MNNKNKLWIFLFLIAVFSSLLLSGCSSSSNDGDKFIMGGTFRLDEGKVIDGNLSIFGGAVSLEEGSTVNGNVVVIGGSVYADGIINGGINGMGGSITLGDSAVVQGDISTFGANVDKSDSAVIRGKIVSQSESGVQLPDYPRLVMPAILKPISDAIGSLLQALVISLLAVLVLLFVPRQTDNVKAAILENPLTICAIGLLTMILLPFVIIILAITIILLPISIAAVVIFILGLLFGWIAIGYELGIRMAKLFKSEWAPAVSAGVGTFALSITSALLSVIPCVGWIIPFLVTLVATGGVVVSVFGTRSPDKPFGIPRVTVSMPNTPPQPPTGQPGFHSTRPSVTIESIFEPETREKQTVTEDIPADKKNEEKASTDISVATSETEKKPKSRSRKPVTDEIPADKETEGKTSIDSSTATSETEKKPKSRSSKSKTDTESKSQSD